MRASDDRIGDQAKMLHGCRLVPVVPLVAFSHVATVEHLYRRLSLRSDMIDQSIIEATVSPAEVLGLFAFAGALCKQ